MLITSTFTSNKVGLVQGHAREPLSKLGQSSSLTFPLVAHQVQSTSTTTASASSSSNDIPSKIAGHTRQHDSSHQIPKDLPSTNSLRFSQAGATALNVFLRSTRSICPLQIVDIVGSTNEETGTTHPPTVRKGKIKISPSSHVQSIPCCIIDAYPFERCEIVATIVKKTVLYRQRRVPGMNNGSSSSHQTLSHNAEGSSHSNGKGKGRADDQDGEEIREDINLMFYELDDDSGASITCVVHPTRVYAKELSEVRAAGDEARQGTNANRTSRLSREGRNCNSSDTESLSSASDVGMHGDEDDDDEMATPRASQKDARMKKKSKLTEQDKPKSDPRLWIYRYKSPPRPARKAARPSGSMPSSSSSSSSTNVPTFTIPFHNEGTIVRIIGKIFINPSRGNERQLEASSIEAVYEEAHVVGKRKVSAKGNQYAEWHHTRKCRRLRMDYKDRQKVREMIGLERPVVNGMGGCDASEMSLDSNREDSMVPSFFDTQESSNVTPCISSTSLLDASRLPSSTHGGSKSKRAKLPSCSTLYKQKIPITREIFALYAHQFFRDILRKKKTQGDKTEHADEGNVLDGRASGQSQTLVELVDNGASVAMDDMKEDKNLKWLAEIYARNEAKKQMIHANATPRSNVVDRHGTPLTAKNRFARSVESSVILPSSSPISKTKPNPAMSDTTNITPRASKVTSTTTASTADAKLRPSASAVLKIRNELFRSTIFKLVKEGIIVIIPSDVLNNKQESQRCTCEEKALRYVESLPDVKTAKGEPLRSYTLAKLRRQPCACFTDVQSTKSSKEDGKVIRSIMNEDRYALLTPSVLLPVIEKITARLRNPGANMHGKDVDIDLERIWTMVRRYDDMWMNVTRETVREAIESM